MDYNAQVPRRVGEYGVLQGFSTDRQKTRVQRQQVITTVLFVLYISPEESKQLAAGHCNLFHYPRYPWEKKGSYGSCTGAIEQRCLVARS